MLAGAPGLATIDSPRGQDPTASGFRIDLVGNPRQHYDRPVKTTADTLDDELSDAMRFTRAKTKREAVVTALADFNRRRRMAELVEYAGTCPGMMTVEELHAQRWERMKAGDPD